MQDHLHEFYDNRRPAHPLALTPDAVFHIIRTDVVAAVYNKEKGYSQITFRHYVSRAPR